MQSSVTKFRITVHPCDKAKSPCKNNGLCKKDFNGFTCDCSEDWTGNTCQQKGFDKDNFKLSLRGVIDCVVYTLI